MQLSGAIVYCGLTSGSGWVAVVALERGGWDGSNGGCLKVAVAVLAELRLFLAFLEHFFC
jgi:hypothetical protein